MVSDDDVQQFSDRTMKHARSLWKLMCSTMDMVSSVDGSVHMVCQDRTLFEVLASQHQRLTGERVPRRPDDFFVTRQTHCPYQCAPSGNGCPACMSVQLALDDFSWSVENWQ